MKITHIAAEFVAVGFRVKSGSKSHVMLLYMQLCMCVRAASHAQRRADSVDGRVTCVHTACRLRTNAVIALSQFYASNRAGARTPRTPRPGGGGLTILRGLMSQLVNLFIYLFIVKA